MAARQTVLVFSVADRRYALEVADVERIVFAAELAPLLDAPAHIAGLMNIAGEIMPVVDVRRRLGLPPREMNVRDRFVVTRSGGAPAALLVDAVEGVVDLPVQRIEEGAAGAAVAEGGELVELCRAETLVSATDTNATKPRTAHA